MELGPEPGVRQLAYKAGSEAALDEIAAIAQAEGLPVRWDTERDRPRILRMQDPFGFPIAFYYESVKHPWLLQRFDLHRGPGIQRIDHINVLSPQVKQLSEWYQKHLDFRLTEFTEDETGRIWATWMQRKGHAHDLATTNGAGPRCIISLIGCPTAREFRNCAISWRAHLKPTASSAGPDATASPMPISYICVIPTDTASNSTHPITLSVDPDFEPIRWQLHDPRRQALWGGTRA